MTHDAVSNIVVGSVEDNGLQFPDRERHVIAPVTFTFEVKVVFDFYPPENVKTVSYTHLDVYKRQLLNIKLITEY